MCGIAGQLRFDGSPVNRTLLDAMADLEVHRGPDASGSWTSGSVGLAHRRLAIIDLTEQGQQPMPNEDSTVWVTFNGEIYNFQELRRELVGKGHVFRSSSDTEVIVHLYEEEGPNLVDRLRGMYAFGIWDARAEILVLARDRVGKKPLFYHCGPSALTFASEVGCLFASSEVPRRPNELAIHHYLTYQYVPSPLSAFEDIRKLEPGHVLTCTREGHVLDRRYWRLDFRDKSDISEVEALERADELIREAVGIRMISDVPLGAFLSGGVDSSLVVAMMAERSSGPVRTFSIGFTDGQFNELPYARQVAERYGTSHTEFVIRPDAIEVLPALVRHYGEPFADSSALPSYYLAQMTRKHVTVALNGDGGDESFGGYARYVYAAKYKGFAVLPRRVRDALRGSLPLHALSLTQPVSRKVRRLLEMILTGGELRYLDSMSYFLTGQKCDIYSQEFGDRYGPVDSNELLYQKFASVLASNWTERLLAVDVESYLPDDLLVKVDIASMANSLEARSPLLDQRVMEFAAALPLHLKVRGTETKYLLKRLAERYVPAEVIYRPKMGFGVPIGAWFRGELSSYVKDVLLDSRSLSRGYFDMAAIQRLISVHEQGIEDKGPQLWALLCLELWHQEFIDSTLGRR